MRLAAAVVATGVTLLLLDLSWIGVVAAPLYATLGPLQRPTPLLPAVILFYGMYVGVIVVHAVRPARDTVEAARRGAGLGFACYATYELTNWAVIAGWPAVLVPVDLTWGVVLTATAAAVGRRVLG